MIDIDDFSVEKECWYKEEHYSVRDNGAIFRHKRQGKAKRPNDNIWTFGKVVTNHYLYYSGVPVHRIVATAFIGEPPTEQHIVDHIDTNRQNNRPENLRWLTKLENILNNEITRAKVEFICGSIEAFLENPTLLYEHESEDRNFKWMRAVSKEEAANSLKNKHQWLKHPKPSERTDNQNGNWIFQNNLHSSGKFSGIPEKIISQPSFKVTASFPRQVQAHSSKLTLDMIRKSLTRPYSDIKPESSNQQIYESNPIVSEYSDSLTPCALQHKDWQTQTEFPQCPSEYMGLEGYCCKLQKGVVFSKNRYGETYVKDAAISIDGKQIVVKVEMPKNDIKWGSVDLIFEHEGKYAHKSCGTYFEEIGAEKYFILNQGKEWTGGDVFDDYC